VKRAGGWFLGLLVVAAMAGGGWFALRRVYPQGSVDVLLLRTLDEREPTANALRRGAEFALEEAGLRAGRYRVRLLEDQRGLFPLPPVWIGISEGILLRGDEQPPPLSVTAFDTHPWNPTGCFRITPDCDRQGRTAAQWAKQSKAARVFLLRDKPSLKSEAIAAAFESAARERGLAIDGPVDSSLERPALFNRILASGADLLFYSGEEAPYSTAFTLFSALREKGFAGILVMAEADPEVSFLATRPSLVEGTYLVSPFAPPPPELAARMGTTPGPHVTASYFAMKAAL